MIKTIVTAYNSNNNQHRHWSAGGGGSVPVGPQNWLILRIHGVGGKLICTALLTFLIKWALGIYHWDEDRLLYALMSMNCHDFHWFPKSFIYLKPCL